jgi:hypothetical protein
MSRPRLLGEIASLVAEEIGERSASQWEEEAATAISATVRRRAQATAKNIRTILGGLRDSGGRRFRREAAA